MKKVIFLIIFFSACVGSEVADESTTTSTTVKDTTTTSSSTTTTVKDTTTTSSSTTTTVKDTTTTIEKEVKPPLNPDLVQTFIPDSAELEGSTLKGYLHAYSTGGKNGSNYGISFYTGIWSTFEEYLPLDFQRGHGTWITANNCDT